MPFRRRVVLGQKEMMYATTSRCARNERDSAEVRKKEERRGSGGKGSKENEGREGDEKRTAVVRGYHELHNSWPSHNRAAQGCERADGMSFSFRFESRGLF